MERSSTLDMDVLINVLNQGNDHIRELRAQLDKPGSSEACKSLARQAQSAFAAAIGLAKLPKHTPSNSDSPLSTSDSTRSEGSVQKAFKEQGRREICKTKRKAMPRWSRHVRVCSAAGSSMEGPVDDGYSWRKYGQKDILGSKFPRGYYRCTHRHTHGCLATKQVQRSDVDVAVFQVIYRGAHTCSRDRLSIPSATSPHEEQSLQQNTTPTTTNRLISNDQQTSSSPSFSFPSMRTESSMKPDNAHFMESYNSPAFMTTAAASEMSFSPSLCGPSSVGGGGPDFCRSGNSEIAEMLSAAASDFGLEHIVFDIDFPFEF